MSDTHCVITVRNKPRTQVNGFEPGTWDNMGDDDEVKPLTCINKDIMILHSRWVER